MADNEKQITEEQNGTNANPEPSGAEDYIAALKAMRANSVPREELEKVKAEKKALLEAIVNGETIEQPKSDKPTAGALRETLLRDGAKMSNLQYVRAVCDLRDAVIAEGGRDPFVQADNGERRASQEDFARADRLYDTFRECIEYADGDSEAFTNELMRRTANDRPPVRAR